MNNLSTATRLALRLGFKTKAYHQFVEAQELHRHNENRRDAFLNRPRVEVIGNYPETAPIFEVQDSALRFYSDVLIATPKSINTNRRNHLRAQMIALDALII